METCEHRAWLRRWNKYNRLQYNWKGLQKKLQNSCDVDWFIEQYGDDEKITCKECNKSFCTGHFNPNTNNEKANICYRCEGKWGWCYACLKPDSSPDESIRRAAGNIIHSYARNPWEEEEKRAELGLPSYETELSEKIAEYFPDKKGNRGFRWSRKLCKECEKWQDDYMDSWERDIDR